MFQCFCNDNAFARRQAVGLDDNRCALLAKVGKRWLEFGEVAIGRSGDVVSGKEVLGKGFGAFQLCCALAGAKAGQAAFGEEIHHAVYQWRFGANDGQRDIVVLGKVCQCLEIAYAYLDIFYARVQRSAGVAWCDINGFNIGRLGRLPSQSVLTATGANNQYVHFNCVLFLRPSRLRDLAKRP